MSIVQQTQSISQAAPWLSDHPALPYVAMGAIILVQSIALVAGQVFALVAAIALLCGISAHLQDTNATWIFATGITLLIIGISLAALFPLYAPEALGGAIAVGVICYGYAFYKMAIHEEK